MKNLENLNEEAMVMVMEMVMGIVVVMEMVMEVLIPSVERQETFRKPYLHSRHGYISQGSGLDRLERTAAGKNEVNMCVCVCV